MISSCHNGEKTYLNRNDYSINCGFGVICIFNTCVLSNVTQIFPFVPNSFLRVDWAGIIVAILSMRLLKLRGQCSDLTEVPQMEGRPRSSACWLLPSVSGCRSRRILLCKNNKSLNQHHWIFILTLSWFWKLSLPCPGTLDIKLLHCTFGLERNALYFSIKNRHLF